MNAAATMAAVALPSPHAPPPFVPHLSYMEGQFATHALIIEQQRRIKALEAELEATRQELASVQARSLQAVSGPSTAAMPDMLATLNNTPDASNSQCLPSEDVKKGSSRYWTADEHARFLEGLKLFGQKDIKSISRHVGTRSATQVRTHAQKYYLRIERERVKADGFSSDLGPASPRTQRCNQNCRPRSRGNVTSVDSHTAESAGGEVGASANNGSSCTGEGHDRSRGNKIASMDPQSVFDSDSINGDQSKKHIDSLIDNENRDCRSEKKNLKRQRNGLMPKDSAISSIVKRDDSIVNTSSKHDKASDMQLARTDMKTSILSRSEEPRHDFEEPAGSSDIGRPNSTSVKVEAKQEQTVYVSGHDDQDCNTKDINKHGNDVCDIQIDTGTTDVSHRAGNAFKNGKRKTMSEDKGALKKEKRLKHFDGSCPRRDISAEMASDLFEHNSEAVTNASDERGKNKPSAAIDDANVEDGILGSGISSDGNADGNKSSAGTDSHKQDPSTTRAVLLAEMNSGSNNNVGTGRVPDNAILSKATSIACFSDGARDCATFSGTGPSTDLDDTGAVMWNVHLPPRGSIERVQDAGLVESGGSVSNLRSLLQLPGTDGYGTKALGLKRNGSCNSVLADLPKNTGFLSRSNSFLISNGKGVTRSSSILSLLSGLPTAMKESASSDRLLALDGDGADVDGVIDEDDVDYGGQHNNLRLCSASLLGRSGNMVDSESGLGDRSLSFGQLNHMGVDDLEDAGAVALSLSDEADKWVGEDASFVNGNK